LISVKNKTKTFKYSFTLSFGLFSTFLSAQTIKVIGLEKLGHRPPAYTKIHDPPVALKVVPKNRSKICVSFFV